MPVGMQWERSTVETDSLAHSRTRSRTAPVPAFAGQGPFWLVWQVLGSNQRRRSRRFYRLLYYAGPDAD
jgi:hypothetical protein